MIYIVRRGDTLYSIAKKHNVTIIDILDANVICNVNLIFEGQLLIIPTEQLELPKAGGLPYYIVMPGDSLYCLANQFNTSVEFIRQGNNISNPNLIYPGDEILIAFDIPGPGEIYETWKTTGDNYCDTMSSLMMHGIFYIGTFTWEAIGVDSITYLEDLLKHQCSVVRFYAIVALGRIAECKRTVEILSELINDPEPFVAEMSDIALKRIRLVREYNKRLHVLMNDNQLFERPDFASPSVSLEKGTAIRVLKWRIPSPTGEEGPRGDLQEYDYI